MEDMVDTIKPHTVENNAQPQSSLFHKEDHQSPDDYSAALLGLFFYSTLMFTVPIGMFFVLKWYLEEHFDLGSPYTLLVPALVSIALVNIIIMLYVCKAFKEDKKELQQSQNRPIEERKKRE